MKVEQAKLRLETKRAGLALEQVELDGCFSGYASLFGDVDLGHDIIDSGAFAKSLSMRGIFGIRMLWQHNAHEPIGVWTILREDRRGLYVEGQLARGVTRAREALELMRSGALDGLSIGFRTVRARKENKTGLRHIVEADLWEISIVTFPMLSRARINSVKGRALPSMREFESWMTQDAGFSQNDARTVITKGYAALIETKTNEQDAASASFKRLAERLRLAAKQFS